MGYCGFGTRVAGFKRKGEEEIQFVKSRDGKQRP